MSLNSSFGTRAHAHAAKNALLPQRCSCVCFGSLHQTMLQESCQRTRDVARDHVPCEPAPGANGLSCPVACYCETTLLRRQGRSGSWATRRWRGFFVDRDGDRRQAPSLLSPYILETESFLCQNSPFEAPLHFLQKCSARCCPGISVTFCAPEHFLFSFVRLRRTSSDLGTQRTRG